MSKKGVCRDADLARLPPLTEKQKSELATLAERPDADIDTSEIPPLTAKFWTDAARGRFYKPIKTSTTAHRRRRAGLAARARQRLPVPHQRYPAAGDADRGRERRAKAGFARKVGAATRSRTAMTGEARRVARSAASARPPSPEFHASFEAPKSRSAKLYAVSGASSAGSAIDLTEASFVSEVSRLSMARVCAPPSAVEDH